MKKKKNKKQYGRPNLAYIDGSNAKKILMCNPLRILLAVIYLLFLILITTLVLLEHHPYFRSVFLAIYNLDLSQQSLDSGLKHKGFGSKSMDTTKSGFYFYLSMFLEFFLATKLGGGEVRP